MVRTVKKPEERRAEILQAARFLFQTQDYEQTTMQDVMDHLGIAKGTIYYYFKSKEELLEAVIEDMVAGNFEQMQKQLDQASGNALEKIRLLIAAGNMEEGNELILDQLHNPGNMVLHVRMLAAAVQKQAPLYARVIEQGNAEGLFQVANPLEAAEMILLSIQFLTDQGVYPWTQQAVMRRAFAFPTMIENLLKAQPGSFQFLLPQMPDNGEI